MTTCLGSASVHICFLKQSSNLWFLLHFFELVKLCTQHRTKCFEIVCQTQLVCEENNSVISLRWWNWNWLVADRKGTSRTMNSWDAINQETGFIEVYHCLLLLIVSLSGSAAPERTGLTNGSNKIRTKARTGISRITNSPWQLLYLDRR